MSNGNNIHDLVLSCGLTDFLSKCAAAQASYETNSFTSTVFKQNNNCFGMTYAGQSLATQGTIFFTYAGEKYYYAKYDNINKSCADFVRWWLAKRGSVFSLPLFVDTVEKYVQFLKNNNYFTDDYSIYLSGVQSYYKQLWG